jgi:uncharacterized membrane protein YfcA
MDPIYSLAGAFVGLFVGLTGVGGGSLMAPLLIIFGINPAVAVGTDLWFAAITKTVGSGIHQKYGSPDWQLVRRLALGSVPAAILTVLYLSFFHQGRLESDLLLTILGGVLLLTALLMLVKNRITAPLRKFHKKVTPKVQRRQMLATVVGGLVVGVLVTLTSVGAGALVAVLLALTYPLRLSAKTIVGTDIIHAVPLTLVAALGHSWLGNVDVWLLASLLIGSIPGIIVGSMVAGKVNDNLVRYALSAMLAVSAFKMLLG